MTLAATCKTDPKNSSIELEVSKADESPVQQIFIRLLVIFGGIMLLCSSRIPALLVAPTPLFYLPYLVGISSSIVFLLCILSLAIWRHILRRGNTFKHWRLRTRRPIFILTTAGFLAYCAFSIAFWPVYGIWSLPLFTVVAYAILSALSFV